MCQARGVKRSLLTLVTLLASASIPAASGCSTGAVSGDAAADAAPDRVRLAKPIILDARCRIEIDTPALLDSPHVAIDTPVTYNSNPPASGPHYPIWAAFQEYQAPVDRRYYVHDLEHGAVVLLHNCAAKDAGADCAANVAGLRAAVASIPDDPLCAGTEVRVRAIITPDPLLDVPLAVVAWGWTYKADCLDQPSLNAFVNAHYGQGTEALCANGQPQF
jgi:hypothetical protein